MALSFLWRTRKPLFFLLINARPRSTFGDSSKLFFSVSLLPAVAFFPVSRVQIAAFSRSPSPLLVFGLPTRDPPLSLSSVPGPRSSSLALRPPAPRSSSPSASLQPLTARSPSPSPRLRHPAPRSSSPLLLPGIPSFPSRSLRPPPLFEGNHAIKMPSDDKYKMDALLRGLYAAEYARRDNTPCQIEEGLFLGSVGAAFRRDELKASNVTHILTVAKSLEPAFPNDFVYKKIEVLDNPYMDLAQHFDACIEFIDGARRGGGAVLVHCFAGRSRSVTIVAAYLMKKHRMSVYEALTLVRSKRPQISPNHGFIQQLEAFQSRLRAHADAETSEQ